VIGAVPLPEGALEVPLLAIDHVPVELREHDRQEDQREPRAPEQRRADEDGRPADVDRVARRGEDAALDERRRRPVGPDVAPGGADRSDRGRRNREPRGDRTDPDRARDAAADAGHGRGAVERESDRERHGEINGRIDRHAGVVGGASIGHAFPHPARSGAAPSGAPAGALRTRRKSSAMTARDATGPAIAVDHLEKRFGALEAVRGISFEVARGTIFGLLGRNGAGKTTTLEICIGLKVPTSGGVRVLGLDPSRRRDFERLKHRVGVQLQSTSLPEKARVGEILELYAVYYAVRPDTAALAARVGLGDKLDRPVGKLSGGEQQRLALALALLHDPDVLFLDEPTAGMDAFGRRILWAEVERLRAAGKTMILTTHYIEEAERLCDEICIVQAGRIVAQDGPAALVARHGGDAMVDITAPRFTPGDALASLGVWTSPEEGRWSVALRGEAGPALAAIVARTTELGATIRELDLRKPDLEDAFVAITGEALDEAAVA